MYFAWSHPSLHRLIQRICKDQDQNIKTTNPKWLCNHFSLLPVGLLSSVACELAPLRIVLFMCFFYLFLLFYFYFYFFTSLFIRVSSAMIMYDKRTLLDIGQRYTNLIQDTLSTDPAWPLEILQNNELNNDHLNNPKREKETPRETCWNPQQTEGKGSQSSSTEYSAR